MVCMYVCMYVCTSPMSRSSTRFCVLTKANNNKRCKVLASFESWVGFHLVTWPRSGITHISFTKEVPKGHPFNLLQVKVSRPNISCIKERQEHQLEFLFMIELLLSSPKLVSSNPTISFFFILNTVKWANLDCMWCDTREHTPIYRFDIESNR